MIPVPDKDGEEGQTERRPQQIINEDSGEEYSDPDDSLFLPKKGLFSHRKGKRKWHGHRTLNPKMERVQKPKDH